MTSMLVPVAAMRVATPLLSSVQHQRRIFTCKPRRSARIGPHTARRTVARSAKDFHVPDRLVTLDEGLARLSSSRDAPAVGAARYHVIFTTGEKMGSGLSAPDAGVQIMLITEDGTAFMHRCDRYPDVCGDSSLAIYSYPRFERGSVDEVVFDAPDMGMPCAIWVAPEQGGDWMLEEVEVRVVTQNARASEFETDDGTLTEDALTSSASVSFPCGEKLRDAIELRPSAFVKLTPEQKLEMRLEGLREYGALKTRMLLVTGAAVVAGCAVTAAMNGGSNDGGEAMRSFASGGGVGLVYLWMLTRNVDALGGNVVVQATENSDTSNNSPSILRMLGTLGNVLLSGASSSPVRIALVATAGAAGARCLGLDDGLSSFGHQANYGDALCAILGFFSYKAGVLVAGFSGTDVMHPTPEPAYARVEDTRTVDGRAGGERW